MEYHTQLSFRYWPVFVGAFQLKLEKCDWEEGKLLEILFVLALRQPPFAQSSWSQCFLNSRFKSLFKIATKWTFYVMFSFTLDIMSQLYLMFENILFQTFESFQNIVLLFYTAVWEVRKILGCSFFKAVTALKGLFAWCWLVIWSTRKKSGGCLSWEAPTYYQSTAGGKVEEEGQGEIHSATLDKYSWMNLRNTACDQLVLFPPTTI